MTEAQKVIKYFAIALALFIIVSIISGILFGITSIGKIFSSNETEVTDKMEESSFSSEVRNLNIDIVSSDIVIKLGDSFKVMTNNSNIQIKQDINSVKIVEKKHHLFNDYDQSQLVIYIPNKIFDKVTIDGGAGNVNIESLITQELSLDLGAGKVEINQLTVLNNTEIESGAGEVKLDNSILNNLELDMGVGKFSLEAKLLGNSEIDHGIGEFNLSLLGKDYQIHVDKGIGSVTVNDTEVKDNETIGSGINKIKINSGIGSIKINFKDDAKVMEWLYVRNKKCYQKIW